ncbi:hypothetical protein Erwinia_phage_Fougasse_00023 [Erwinia phage Fougasse]|nr:hypothetical protein Erwinia_phage_Fougasse_00023 [Erwinia phage Fougasse]WJN64219.1 hypothetical protein Erwinia_phage_Nougat_00023 [Erwinia phage Nougat]
MSEKAEIVESTLFKFRFTGYEPNTEFTYKLVQRLVKFTDDSGHVRYELLSTENNPNGPDVMSSVSVVLSLEVSFGSSGVQLLSLNSNLQDAPAKIKAILDAYGSREVKQ